MTLITEAGILNTLPFYTFRERFNELHSKQVYILDFVTYLNLKITCSKMCRHYLEMEKTDTPPSELREGLVYIFRHFYKSFITCEVGDRTGYC